MKEISETYITEFNSQEEFDNFPKAIQPAAAYDTGVKVYGTDVIVTLSTCTKESDDNRMVVRGVKESEKMLD